MHVATYFILSFFGAADGLPTFSAERRQAIDVSPNIDLGLGLENANSCFGIGISVCDPITVDSKKNMTVTGNAPQPEAGDVEVNTPDNSTSDNNQILKLSPDVKTNLNLNNDNSCLGIGISACDPITVGSEITQTVTHDGGEKKAEEPKEKAEEPEKKDEEKKEEKESHYPTSDPGSGTKDENKYPTTEPKEHKKGDNKKTYPSSEPKAENKDKSYPVQEKVDDKKDNSYPTKSGSKKTDNYPTFEKAADKATTGSYPASEQKADDKDPKTYPTTEKKAQDKDLKSYPTAEKKIEEEKHGDKEHDDKKHAHKLVDAEPKVSPEVSVPNKNNCLGIGASVCDPITVHSKVDQTS
ncbi:hypothetical protein GGS23DRAFT_47451 [Durotheca rogersii]|uniref:uncharacterized protein n=1 Tax=Durotheca rogersii TaxID=419775 RepID=UPI0022200F03|nr:uncharacterized protein GGS23DRAFT_47451 [Durotheca rogersii]KAI5862999.1 hypothetical protein GGS23DRAFT_47451 [Durotheca rogersii]